MGRKDRQPQAVDIRRCLWRGFIQPESRVGVQVAVEDRAHTTDGQARGLGCDEQELDIAVKHGIGRADCGDERLDPFVAGAAGSDCIAARKLSREALSALLRAWSRFRSARGLDC